MNWEERRTIAGKYKGFDEVGNNLYRTNHSQELRKISDKKRARALALIEDGYTDEEIAMHFGYTDICE